MLIGSLEGRKSTALNVINQRLFGVTELDFGISLRAGLAFSISSDFETNSVVAIRTPELGKSYFLPKSSRSRSHRAQWSVY